MDDRDDTSDEELPPYINKVTCPVNRYEDILLPDSILDSNKQVPPTRNFIHEVSRQEIHHDNAENLFFTITCLHFFMVDPLMIFSLTILVQYMVNYFSILEVFVQTVHVRK